MPVVKTLHNIVVNTNKLAEVGFNSNISILVSEITSNILRDMPVLVADVAHGKTSEDVLTKAIIKDIDKNRYHLGLNRELLIKKIFDFMFGYGELQDYVDSPDVTDIDGTRFDQFSIKRNGQREKISVNFGSEKMFDMYCKLIAIRNLGILNENDSQCRVTDDKKRLRINISIKPRNVSGPAISIRKHRLISYTLDNLIELGMINNTMFKLFTAYDFNKKTVLFCGKGAAGKTTLLRAVVNSLPEMERVLIVESDAEIFPDKPYCIQQRVKKENEGGLKVTLRELVKDGLTMSLDTFCVGEIVSDEAWEFVKGSFTGHRGLATIHAESAGDVMSRLLTLCKGANISESEQTVKSIMGKCIDAIFYLSDFKVVEAIWVRGYNSEQDIFEYENIV